MFYQYHGNHTCRRRPFWNNVPAEGYTHTRSFGISKPRLPACLPGKNPDRASATDHVKRFNLPFVHFCNISQIQCFTCTMNRTITLCCIFIKLTKIHQTIFHSSCFMRCSYTFYLGLLTYFLLSPKFFYSLHEKSTATNEISIWHYLTIIESPLPVSRVYPSVKNSVGLHHLLS